MSVTGSEGKSPPERLGYRLEYDVIIDLGEIGCKDVNWI
jgi:hypothetical protein